MSIRQTVISTAVALTTVALIAPATVGAVTVAELQAQIAVLQAQLSTLSSTSTSATVPAACAGITFTRNLRVGSTGADVKCLQAAMNANGYTVASAGAGSPGNETTYYGSKTNVAVQAYQAANGITPYPQVGPLTRAKLNAWLGGSTPAPTTPTTPTTPVPTGAGLSVMLASDNPATGTVVDASALHPMLKLTFTNGDNAEVMVTGLKLKRIGVSADASVTNTYLFDGATRLTDGAAVSTTMVNFNASGGLFKVPANGSKTISVLANVDGTASETVGFQVVSSADVTTNASSVKGTYPISGNLMTVATGTLAGVEWNATTTPAAASIDPQDGYTVFQNSVIVTTRAVDLTRIAFKKTGSTADTDLQNWKLYIDGVQVGSTTQLAKNSTGDWYATFDLTGSPKRLEAGTRVVKVLADIVGGSSLTFTTNLWNVADVTVVDTQYYANVLSDLVSDAAFTKRSSGEQTINGGTVTFTKMTASPSGDIVDAASNTLMGKWEVKAAGEKVKIETLNVRVIFGNTVTTGDNDTSAAGDITIRNGTLLANGVQIGSTTSTINGAAGTQFSLGSSLIVVPGSPVTLEFKGDIYDNKGTANDIDATDTLQATIVGSSTNNNATGQVSANTIDAPASNVTANVLTVRQGTLTLAKYTAYTNHTVVAPLTAYKMGHYTLTAATSEAVNITAINVAVDDVSGESNNIYVKFMDGTTTALTTSTKATVAATNSWSINYTLAAGKTIDVLVFMDVKSTMTSNDGIVTTDIDGTTASSAVTADSAAVAGQTITFSSGAFTTAFDGTPQNKVVSGNQSVLAGRFKLTSSYRDYYAKEMRFTVNSNAIVISTAELRDATTGAVLKNMPVSSTGDFRFTGLNVLVPTSTSKRVDLYYNLAAKETPATDSAWNLDTKAIMTYIKYADSDGTETEVNPPTAASNTANTVLVYKAVPAIKKGILTKSDLVNGQPTDLYKFTVTAPTQGTVHMKQFKIDLSWSDGGGNDDTLEVESLKLYENGVDITSTVAIKDQTGGTVESTSGVSELSSKLLVTWDDDTEESTTSAGTTTEYVIRGTPQGFNKSGTVSTAAHTDSVSFQFVPDAAAQTSGYNFLNNGTTVPTSTVRLYSSSTANASAEDANLIWSDESAVAHLPDDDASTKDWSNSYLFLTVDAEGWNN